MIIVMKDTPLSNFKQFKNQSNLGKTWIANKTTNTQIITTLDEATN